MRTEELPLNYQRQQAMFGLTEGQKEQTELANRWHNAQSDPKRETAAKKLARACGNKSVVCVCCNQAFSAEVRA